MAPGLFLFRAQSATGTADSSARGGQIRFAVATGAGTPYVRAMKIAIASDHAALELKADLAGWLRELGHDVADLGTATTDSVDYPDYGYRLGEHLAAGRADRAIALCGSGIGIAIAMNRNPAVRCAQVGEPLSAKFARTHNDANAIALGARIVGPEMARACVAAFLDADFEGGRHARRVDKLSNPQITSETRETA